MKVFSLLALLLCVFTLAACGDSTDTTTQTQSDAANQSDPAAEAVAAYITAKVEGDRDQLAQLICSAQEARLEAEVMSFSAVEAAIEDMDCSTDDDGTTVTCSGQIVAVYNGENREFPLGTYSVVEEDGAWKWCGETVAE